MRTDSGTCLSIGNLKNALRTRWYGIIQPSSLGYSVFYEEQTTSYCERNGVVDRSNILWRTTYFSFYGSWLQCRGSELSFRIVWILWPRLSHLLKQTPRLHRLIICIDLSLEWFLSLILVLSPTWEQKDISSMYVVGDTRKTLRGLRAKIFFDSSTRKIIKLHSQDLSLKRHAI